MDRLVPPESRRDAYFNGLLGIAGVVGVVAVVCDDRVS